MSCIEGLVSHQCHQQHLFHDLHAVIALVSPSQLLLSLLARCAPFPAAPPLWPLSLPEGAAAYQIDWLDEFNPVANLNETEIFCGSENELALLH